MRFWVDRNGERIEVIATHQDGLIEVTIAGETLVVEHVKLQDGLHALFYPDGRNFAVASERLGPNHWRLLLAQRQFEVRLRDPLERELDTDGHGFSGPHEVCAPIPGKVIGVVVAQGDSVKAGQPLIVLEAMKMENQICAEGPGVVEKILVTLGSTVDRGQALVVVS